MEELLRPSRLVLVTGASGFLGSQVIRTAWHEGWHVRALMHRPASAVIDADVFVGDLHDRKLLERCCEGVSAVIHTAGLAHVFGRAAHDTSRFLRVNSEGTELVARAAVQAGVQRVVLASSVSVYGASANGTPCDETTPCQPRTSYAVSKHEAELRAAEAVAGSSTHLAMLRFATIYGEGDRGNVARLVAALAKGRFVWPGKGWNRKSLLYRNDAARACLCALRATPPGTSVFNVSAEDVTMQQIVATICVVLGRPVPRFRVPAAMLTIAAQLSRSVGDPAQLSRTMLQFLHDDVYARTAFEQATGFAPTVSLQEGLRQQIDAAGFSHPRRSLEQSSDRTRNLVR